MNNFRVSGQRNCYITLKRVKKSLKTHEYLRYVVCLFVLCYDDSFIELN